MSQNLCLICCYSFQEKPNRFISDEARESFDKFSKQLGFPFEVASRGGGPSPGGKNGSLGLPFGSRITVCGDCLSLVVVYVQRRAVQNEKEEHLLKLQREVCKAIKELTSVVEDVQCHIDQLHSTVKMGDDKTLGEFIGRSGPQTGSAKKQKESQAKSFREKVLTLNTGAGKFKNKDTRRPRKDESILIKTEVVEAPPSSPFDGGEPSSFWNEDFDDTLPDREEPADQSQAPAEPNTFPTSTRRNQDSNSSLSRSSGRTSASKTVKNNDSWPEPEEDSFQDFPDDDDDQEGSEENEESGNSDWSEDEETEKPKRKKSRGGRPQKDGWKPKQKPSVKYGVLLSPEEAARWKDDLLSRIMEQFQNQIYGEELPVEPIPPPPPPELKSEGGLEAPKPPPPPPPPPPKYFQILEDKLQFGKVTVRVISDKRMLECTRCYKQFYEERDCLNGTTQLETLMRSHILDKHYAPRKERPARPEIEVVSYIASHTKRRLTHKLADNRRYAYDRRRYKGDHVPAYYRCDFRKGGCAAGILLKDGKFTRLRKGWNPDGTHAIHPPDVEKTNIQMAMGKAKELYMSDDSRHIDEVVEIIRNETGIDEQALPLEKLKKALRYSKYRRRGMAPEEKLNQEQQCCYCGKICKAGGALTRHMNACHREYMKVDQ